MQGERGGGKGGTYGSVLLVTAIGVFLYEEMLLAMYRVESSRSFATLVASFPVAFWTFYSILVDICRGCGGNMTVPLCEP